MTAIPQSRWRLSLGQRSRCETWSAPLDHALRMTADIAHIMRDIAPVESLWGSS